jgi:Family of unknown function (DUF6174)
MKKTIYAGALVALVLLSGCGGVSPRGFEVELASARANWKSRALRSYTFTVQKGCFCTPESLEPVTITVRDGVASTVPEHLRAYSTIEKVLDSLEAAHKANPEVLNVSFTPEGWPSTLYIDPYRELADDEYSVTLSGLKPL